MKPPEKEVRNKRKTLRGNTGHQPKDFKDYLESIRLRPATIANNMRYARRFLQWLDKENLSVENCTYNDLLALIKYYRGLNYSPHNINNHLNGVQYYYDYQKILGILQHNPAVNLRVKGHVEKMPRELLSQKQIETIYESYHAETPVQKRNKIMLSLVMYQAIEREEIYFLEPGDINLQKGTVRIRKNTRLQGRELKLNANQILPLQEYTSGIRPKLLKLKGEKSDLSGVAIAKTDKLFITIGTSGHIKDAMRELLRELKQEHEYLNSFTQIRVSVISQWVKEKNIREVQYMAGHASIYSTQRYIRANLDDLKEELSMFHPLK